MSSSVNQEVLLFLKENLSRNPSLQQLSLEFMQITDLLPYMELLSQFPNLRKLSLHGNRIKELPIDLSKLSKVQELDLSNNLIRDITLAIVTMKTLPSLKRLNFPVKKEKEGEIIAELRKLTHLNNVKIVREKEASSGVASAMENVIKTLKSQQHRLAEIEDKYFEEGGRISSEEQFSEELETIVLGAEERFKKDRHLSEQQEHLIYQFTIYQMYDLIKKPAIGLSIDVCEQLGKLLHDITTYQETLLNNIIEFSLKDSEQASSFLEQKGGNKEVETRVMQFEKEIKRLRKQKDEMIAQINQLESENKKYIDSLVKYSRGDKGIVPTLQMPMKSNHPNLSISDRFKTGTAKETSQNFHSHSSGRNLTIKQLKETIEEIYESKLKFDQKNHDGKLPRETMHQYLFTYLNQKYGLKSLTIESANSVVSAIQTYSGEDNDVAVFGKILRNEVDEEFRNVQSELKATVHNLLKMHIKSQYPFKSANEINEQYNEKLTHEISFEECEDIVRYLYNKSDAEKILQTIEIVMRLNKPPEEHHPRRYQSQRKEQQPKKKIKFSMFLQTVLDFQLKNHEKLLKPLIQVFRVKDRDSDGIIDEDEFISIIEELCEEAADLIPELLAIVDPYETKSITFTQVVRLVANYPQSNPILMRYLEAEEEVES